jgi:hypothetical protein
MPQKEKFREAARMWKLQNKRTSKGSTSSRTSSRRPLRMSSVYGSSSSRSRKSRVSDPGWGQDYINI